MNFANNGRDATGRWYLIRSKPREESTAHAQLQRQGFNAFFPRVQQSVRIRGRWSERVGPLFPRYLFLHADAARQSLAPVRSTLGVNEIVRFGSEYATVPLEIIRSLMAEANPDTGVHELRGPLFTAGSNVKIADGPFRGLEGVFECADGEERVSILLEVLGRRTRVSLSVNQVVPQFAA
jgi:transcriptional antiterminator RfaH